MKEWWDGVVSFWSNPTGREEQSVELNEQEVTSALGRINDVSTIVNNAREETISAMAALKSACANVEGVNINEHQFDGYYDSLGSDIKSVGTLLQTNSDDIKAYSKAEGWQVGLATAGMATTKVAEGFFSAFEDVGDGFLSVGGALCGLFGATDAQNAIAGIIAKDYVGDAFHDIREATGINRYSAFTEDSAIATVFELGGNVGGYVLMGGGAAGVAKGLSIGTKGVNAIRLGADTAAAVTSGIGMGTTEGLREGKNFNEAFTDKGLKEGAIQGLLMGGIIKGGQGFHKLNAIRKGSKEVKIAKNELSQLERKTTTIKNDANKLAEDRQVLKAEKKANEKITQESKAGSKEHDVAKAKVEEAKVKLEENKSLIKEKGKEYQVEKAKVEEAKIKKTEAETKLQEVKKSKLKEHSYDNRQEQKANESARKIEEHETKPKEVIGLKSEARVTEAKPKETSVIKEKVTPKETEPVKTSNVEKQSQIERPKVEETVQRGETTIKVETQGNVQKRVVEDSINTEGIRTSGKGISRSSTVKDLIEPATAASTLVMPRSVRSIAARVKDGLSRFSKKADKTYSNKRVEKEKRELAPEGEKKELLRVRESQRERLSSSEKTYLEGNKHKDSKTLIKEEAPKGESEIMKSTEISETIIDDRITTAKNRVFESDKGIAFGKDNPIALHTSSSAVYRCTGMGQIADIVNCNYIRPKIGKLKGGHKNEVFWSRGGEKLFYIEKKAPILEVSADKVRDGQIGCLSLDDLSAVWIFDPKKNCFVNKIDLVKQIRNETQKTNVTLSKEQINKLFETDQPVSSFFRKTSANESDDLIKQLEKKTDDIIGDSEKAIGKVRGDVHKKIPEDGIKSESKITPKTKPKEEKMSIKADEDIKVSGRTRGENSDRIMVPRRASSSPSNNLREEILDRIFPRPKEPRKSSKFSFVSDREIRRPIRGYSSTEEKLHRLNELEKDRIFLEQVRNAERGYFTGGSYLYKSEEYNRLTKEVLERGFRKTEALNPGGMDQVIEAAKRGNYALLSPIGNSRNFWKKFSGQELEILYREYIKGRSSLSHLLGDSQRFSRKVIGVGNQEFAKSTIGFNKRSISTGGMNIDQGRIELSDFFDSSGRSARGFYGVDQAYSSRLCQYRCLDSPGLRRRLSYEQTQKMISEAIKEGKQIPRFEMIKVSREYDKMRDYLMEQGFSHRDASIIISSMNDEGACTYAAISNNIFYLFRDSERYFNRIFGYPMYITLEDGSRVLNSGKLLLDLYVYANKVENGGRLFMGSSINRACLSNKLDIYGRRIFDARQQVYLENSQGEMETNLIENFLRSKDSRLSFSARNIVDNNSGMFIRRSQRQQIIDDMKKALDRGEALYMGYAYDPRYFPNEIRMHSFDVWRYPNVSTKTWAEGNGHAVAITGMTDYGVYISSWGRKYLISFDDLCNGGSFSIFSTDINML